MYENRPRQGKTLDLFEGVIGKQNSAVNTDGKCAQAMPARPVSAG